MGWPNWARERRRWVALLQRSGTRMGAAEFHALSSLPTAAAGAAFRLLDTQRRGTIGIDDLYGANSALVFRRVVAGGSWDEGPKPTHAEHARDEL